MEQSGRQGIRSRGREKREVGRGKEKREERSRKWEEEKRSAGSAEGRLWNERGP